MRARANHSNGPVELGQHIVADPKICHGQPTFKGTRVMVWQVLELVADGEDWDKITMHGRAISPKKPSPRQLVWLTCYPRYPSELTVWRLHALQEEAI